MNLWVVFSLWRVLKGPICNVLWNSEQSRSRSMYSNGNICHGFFNLLSNFALLRLCGSWTHYSFHFKVLSIQYTVYVYWHHWSVEASVPLTILFICSIWCVALAHHMLLCRWPQLYPNINIIADYVWSQKIVDGFGPTYSANFLKPVYDVLNEWLLLPFPWCWKPASFKCILQRRCSKEYHYPTIRLNFWLQGQFLTTSQGLTFDKNHSINSCSDSLNMQIWEARS